MSRLVVSTILNCFVYTAEKAEVLFLRKTKIYVKNALLLKWLFHYALQIFFVATDMYLVNFPKI